MVNCGPGQEDITNKKNGARVGISIMSIMYFAFLLFLFSYFNFKKTAKGAVSSTTPTATATSSNVLDSNTFLGRFESWFVVKAKSSINSGMIIAILAAGLVLGFNGLIMTPLIST